MQSLLLQINPAATPDAVTKVQQNSSSKHTQMQLEWQHEGVRMLIFQ
jgi:hypothetical protein